ncbi:MAG: penicillin-binding transpeptidase domain-containing protein [bacterium]|nr:penicillin-binding transpeptidase domain-containing protein [bacterium]
MLGKFTGYIRRFLSGRAAGREIDPDEIFLDSSNLPRFDRHQFEGRIERPISRRTVFVAAAAFLLILCLILGKSYALQVKDGNRYATQSEQNRLRHTIIFGSRGVFYDRTGAFLAWNVIDEKEPAFSKRKYLDTPGLAHVLGFLKYPSKDKAGFYYKVDFEGRDGVEKYYNEYVTPENGLKIIETDAHGAIASESVVKPPKDGASVTLTIDARLQEKFYEYIESLAKERGFQGGAGIIMDVENGELLSLVSFPEYDSQAMTDGSDGAAIRSMLDDKRLLFLNRATEGLYTPGSIVKPFVALGALEEDVITPEKEIISTGSISVPNRFDASKPSVFKDWKAHGAVDMRQALAVSSDVYFYEIGGGFEEQKGLGIANIEKYMRLFGFGEEPPGSNFFGQAGVIPTPQWKSANFSGEAWRLGDTYHTAIGQYGFQVTPLQAARGIAAIANGGKLLEPRIIHEANTPPVYSVVPIKTSSFEVVREGMRLAVRDGTSTGLNISQVAIGAKTGTAELGTKKQFVNSWVVGFFPYEKPRYAFAVMMEKGPHDNTIGGLYVMRELFEWMGANTPEYLKNE